MITIFSLGYKGFFVLQNLANEHRSLIDCVVIGRDKNLKNDFSEELIDWCKEKEIPYEERSKFQASNSKSDFFLLLGWRWILEKKEGKEVIVIHDSLLPKYRGFNPLVTALIEGDKLIGATAIFANAEVDAGDIILQKSVTIAYPIKIQEAMEKMAVLYFEIVREIFSLISKGKPLPCIPQSDQDVSFSLWRDELDYFIDWNLDSERIVRQIDANGEPYAGARTYFEGKVLKIFDAKLVEDVKIFNRTPGKVIFKKEGNPVVVCGKGLIMITDLRDELGNPYILPKFRARLT
ncbi:MAG: methionyl-tRNA formyltransferase [Cyclobacteriaceae bacterium]|nr:methionyl-tRNA formyltransferase [Cyclobacteriaceae bacterium]